MLTCTSGQQYSNLTTMAAGELQAGRMDHKTHDLIAVYHADLQTAVAAFDISGILTAVLNLLPLVAAFIPGLAPFVPVITALVPIIQQIVQTFTTGGSVTQLWAQLQQLISQIFNILPKPNPSPFPIPSPLPIPTPSPIPGGVPQP